jgi:hypothetical protein
MTDEGGESALIGLVETAKFYEHVERDYTAALDAVRNALLLLELYAQLRDQTVEAELAHRQARLLNRIAGARGRVWSRVG